MKNRAAHPGVRVWARLNPGVTAGESQAELSVIAQQLAKEYPKSNAGRGFLVEPLRPQVGNVGSTLWLLLGAVSLVLLIACANIAACCWRARFHVSASLRCAPRSAPVEAA